MALYKLQNPVTAEGQILKKAEVPVDGGHQRESLESESLKVGWTLERPWREGRKSVPG